MCTSAFSIIHKYSFCNKKPFFILGKDRSMSVGLQSLTAVATFQDESLLLNGSDFSTFYFFPISHINIPGDHMTCFT